MKYIKLPKGYINKPGVWVGGVPSHIYNWILENIKDPQWDYRDEMFKGITLEEPDAILFRLKFGL